MQVTRAGTRLGCLKPDAVRAAGLDRLGMGETGHAGRLPRSRVLGHGEVGSVLPLWGEPWMDRCQVSRSHGCGHDLLPVACLSQPVLGTLTKQRLMSCADPSMFSPQMRKWSSEWARPRLPGSW